MEHLLRIEAGPVGKTLLHDRPVARSRQALRWDNARANKKKREKLKNLSRLEKNVLPEY